MLWERPRPDLAHDAQYQRIRFVRIFGHHAIADEIIATLAADPNAEVNVTVEIQANFPSGAKDQTKRAVSENAKTLNFKNADWE